MRPVVAALVVVAVVAALAIGIGVAIGLRADWGDGKWPTGRPFFWWLFALCIFGVEVIYLPALVSWFIPFRIPGWHYSWLVTRKDEHRDRFEETRAGRRIIDWARAADQAERPRIARQTFIRGLGYVAVTIPMQIGISFAAIRGDGFTPIEAVPLIVAASAPAIWTASLVLRD